MRKVPNMKGKLKGNLKGNFKIPFKVPFKLKGNENTFGENPLQLCKVKMKGNLKGINER